MGQYQEWLLAQEIDRQLKTEVEALETEILYLKDRIAILEQTVPETENVILEMLLAYLHNQASDGEQSQFSNSLFSSWPLNEREHKNQQPPDEVEWQSRDENIQRWFERWHREIASTARSEEQDGQ